MPDVGEDNIDQYHRILRRKVRSVPLTLTRQSRKHKPRARYIFDKKSLLHGISAHPPIHCSLKQYTSTVLSTMQHDLCSQDK